MVDLFFKVTHNNNYATSATATALWLIS